MSMASSNGASGTSTSLDSFQDALEEDLGACAITSEPHTYDLPPAYDEVVSAEAAQQKPSFHHSPFRYSEIEEEKTFRADPRSSTPTNSGQGLDKSESPIYAEIDEVLSPTKPPKEEEEDRPAQSAAQHIKVSSFLKIFYRFTFTTFTFCVACFTF